MKITESILVVEDEKLLRLSLRELLAKNGYEVLEAANGKDALRLLGEEEPDLVLLDYRLPDMTGIDILRALQEMSSSTCPVLMTAYSRIDNAVEAIKLGAYDYLTKPVNQDDLLATIVKGLDYTRLQREVKRLRHEQHMRYGGDHIIGRSKVLQDVFQMIQKVATSSASTVLVQGESGTGKDLVAKAIHFATAKAGEPFMNITCSALPENLLESELFGHERGSFTDARQQKKGLFELADGGTLFLDEIGELGPALQAKLLRFLQEKTFRRIGGNKDIQVDLRIIAATNRDLEKEVQAGRFREDLFFRLNVVPISLPPLRDRKMDIPDLVDYFIDFFNKEFRKSTRGISREMLACLAGYSWPGNVRELRNLIERAMILEDKEELDITDLPEEIAHFVGAGGREDAAQDLDADRVGGTYVLPQEGVSLREVEFDLVRQALEATAGNQTRAARLLRISRDALRYKMKKFRLL